jgi:hypothetical protein
MFPDILSIAPHFYPMAYVVLLSPIIGGSKGRSSKLQNRTFYLGEPP